MPQDKKRRPPSVAKPQDQQLARPEIQEYDRMQGLMLYNTMVLKSVLLPFLNETMEVNKIGMSVLPEKLAEDLAERQHSAFNFPKLIETFGKELFSSARYEGERSLAENDFFRLTHIPVAKGVEKRASLFHIGGFVPYSDNLFRLLPGANLFRHFIERGIEVYEMKLKCSTACPNPHMLDLTLEKIIDTVHAFSDIAFADCGRKMILEGYCGTGINTYTSFLADRRGMSRKFDLILTFVSPLDAKKCTLFERLHEILGHTNPAEASVDGAVLSGLLDTIQEKVFEKSPMGAFVHGWKNKEWARITEIAQLNLRQQSELAAWYWLSLKHGAYYPLSRDLYVFYSRLFKNGVGEDGLLPGKYKGKRLNLHDLAKSRIRVLVFLGDKDHLVNCHTADILKDILGERSEIVVHQKTGHVAYIFNSNRWNKDDARAFQPDIVETIMRNLPAAAQKPAKRSRKKAGEDGSPPASEAVMKMERAQ